MDQLSPTESSHAAERPSDPPPPSASELKDAILAKLTYSIGKDVVAASQRDWFLAVAFATRDIIVDRWMNSTRQTYAEDRKRVMPSRCGRSARHRPARGQGRRTIRRPPLRG